MNNIDVDRIAKSLCEKTSNKMLSWDLYDYSLDTNNFSFVYFSSIPYLDAKNGFKAEYKQGRIFLIPDYSNVHGLILQSNLSFPPRCLNYKNGFLVTNEIIEQLYQLVAEPLVDLKNYIDDIIQ